MKSPHKQRDNHKKHTFDQFIFFEILDFYMDVRLKTCIKYFEAMAICLQGNFISVRILNLEIINSIDRILKVPPAITEAKLNMPVYNHLNELYLIFLLTIPKSFIENSKV